MSPLSWHHGPPRPVLDSTGLHVWRVALQRPGPEIAALYATLSADERARSARIFFQEDRRRYIVSRGALRSILSRYLDRPAETFSFPITAHGKPFLTNAAIQFNVSHSHEMAVIGFGLDRPVGIDIEYTLRKMDDADALVARFFSATENMTYFALPPEQRRQAFFNGWTRKEAYIKARGEGLSHPLDCFDVELRPGEPAAFLNIDQDPVETARWFLHAFTPAPDYIAALATPGPAGNYQFFDFAG